VFEIRDRQLSLRYTPEGAHPQGHPPSTFLFLPIQLSNSGTQNGPAIVGDTSSSRLVSREALARETRVKVTGSGVSPSSSVRGYSSAPLGMSTREFKKTYDFPRVVENPEDFRPSPGDDFFATLRNLGQRMRDARPIGTPAAGPTSAPARTPQ
jgi:hypothetical protein